MITSPNCFSADWTTCNMGSVKRAPVALCLTLILLGLLGHFVADAACSSGCGGKFATGEQPTTSILHTVFAVVRVVSIAGPLTPVVTLASVIPLSISRFFPPPVRPPATHN